MKKMKKESRLFTTRVEISPLQRDSEGKLRGGFSSVTKDKDSPTNVNIACLNTFCTNESCANKACSNLGCLNEGGANDFCMNDRCTPPPSGTELPSATTTTIGPFGRF